GLRERFQDAHITYVVEPAAAPVVAGNPHLNEVIVTPGRRGLAGFRDDVALIRRLRAGRYDTAIDFPGRGWMYTVRVPRPRHIRPRHAVLNQWDLLSALSIPPPDAGKTPVEMM